VTTGGFYGFDVDATAGTDRTLGLQLGNGDFAPGTLTLRLQNTSGSTITDFDFDYELWSSMIRAAAAASTRRIPPITHPTPIYHR
jgi:hypothetical protein